MPPKVPQTIQATCIECEDLRRFDLDSAGDGADVGVYVCASCSHRIALDLAPTGIGR